MIYLDRVFELLALYSVVRTTD